MVPEFLSSMNAPSEPLRAPQASKGELFQAPKYRWKPGLQHRAFDLRDVPVEDEELDAPDRVSGEIGDCRRIIVGSGLGSGVDDGEYGVAFCGQGNG
jgi:hypothetical protein